MLPLRREQRRLKLLRQNGNQRIADLRRNEIDCLFELFSFCKSGRHQLFQNGSACCGCTKTAPLGVLRRILCTRVLHRCQQRIFRIVLRRCRVTLFDGCSVHRKCAAIGKLRQRHFCHFTAGILLPSGLKNGLSLGGKFLTATQ